MNLLLHLMFYLGPIAMAYCIYRAIKETRAKKLDNVPTWFKASMWEANGPERKWNLK